MTWPPKIPWWVTMLAVIAAVAALTWALSSRRALSRDLAAVKEQHKMEVEGLNVAHKAERDSLVQDLMAEATASATFREQLAKLQAVVPNAKPVAVARGGTERIKVGPAPAGAAGASPAADGEKPAPPEPAACTACPACRLFVGDEIQILTDGAAMETSLGNVAVVGVAKAMRYPAAGGEPEQLADGALKLDVKILDRSGSPGWGFGGLALAGKGGWMLGPLASPPPMTFLGLDWTVLFGGAAGPGGEWAAMLAALARWRL